MELDFDEMTLVTKTLQEVKSCECGGGVEGGVSNSSDDERGSAHEEVSETREGVREILEKGILCPKGARVGERLGNREVCEWGATLRRRGGFFLRSQRADFDPGMSDVPVDEACEGGTYWTVDGDDITQPIGVPSVTDALVTCEIGLCRVVLFEASGESDGGISLGPGLANSWVCSVTRLDTRRSSVFTSTAEPCPGFVTE